MIQPATDISPRIRSGDTHSSATRRAGKAKATANTRNDLQIANSTLQRICVADGFSSEALISLTAAEAQLSEIERENAALRSNIEALTRALAAAEQINREARRLAHHDALTGLPNRLMLKERVQRELASAVLQQRQLALLFIDLNGFKSVNDKYGHAMGDKLLTAVAARITSCIRANDIACRYGGDEFVVLLSNVSSPAIASEVGEKIYKHICRRYVIDDQDCRVSASMGIALYPKDGEHFDALLSTADALMYRNKPARTEQVTLAPLLANMRKLIQRLQARTEVAS
jgi:diguanylate cyclase (GGDEF)-like protein